MPIISSSIGSNKIPTHRLLLISLALAVTGSHLSHTVSPGAPTPSSAAAVSLCARGSSLLVETRLQCGPSGEGWTEEKHCWLLSSVTELILDVPYEEFVFSQHIQI